MSLYEIVEDPALHALVIERGDGKRLTLRERGGTVHRNENVSPKHAMVNRRDGGTLFFGDRKDAEEAVRAFEVILMLHMLDHMRTSSGLFSRGNSPFARVIPAEGVAHPDSPEPHLPPTSPRSLSSPHRDPDLG